MTAITDPDQIARYRTLVAEMVEDRVQFKTSWLQRKKWSVVPVESGMHFTHDGLTAIVRGLREAGSQKCFALASEDLDPLPVCYELSINKGDFEEFECTCGLFWFLITDEVLSWAISCNNVYNLLGGAPQLLERILSKSIKTAREEFVVFARELAHGNPNYPPLRIAEHYTDI